MGICGSKEVLEPLLLGNTKIGGGLRLEDDYKLFGGALGFGRVATVREGVHKESGKEVAVKACSKKVLNARPERISRTSEVEALQSLWEGPDTCDRIIRLFETYEDNNYIYLVLELAKGGDLFHYMAAKDHFSEEDAAKIGKQLLEAIYFCHKKGVVHRDLKPENILLSDPDGLGIKLVDFGSAALVDKTTRGQNSTRLHDFMATPFYAAPEVWEHNYGTEVDTWSVGAVLYVLLTGLPPVLNSQSVKSNPTWQDLQAGKVKNLPPSTSSALTDFLGKLLEPNPELRISTSQALTHPWITGSVPRGKVNLEDSIRGIKAYAKIRQFQKAAVVLLSVLVDNKELKAIGRKIHEINKKKGNLKETELEDLLGSLSMHSQASALKQLRINMLFNGENSVVDNPKIGYFGLPIEFDSRVFLDLLECRKMALKHLNKGRKLEESTSGNSAHGNGLENITPFLRPQKNSISMRFFTLRDSNSNSNSKSKGIYSNRMRKAYSASNLKNLTEESQKTPESDLFDDSYRYDGDSNRYSGDSSRFKGDSTRFKGDSSRFKDDTRIIGDSNVSNGDSKRFTDESNLLNTSSRIHETSAMFEIGDDKLETLNSVQVTEEKRKSESAYRYGGSSVHGELLYRTYMNKMP